MPPNDDVCFTSCSSLKVPHPPSPPPFHLPILFTRTTNSFAQLIDSLKTRSGFQRVTPKFTPLWSRVPSLIRSAELTHSLSGTQEAHSASGRIRAWLDGALVGKSSLLCSASMSMNRRDQSTQYESKTAKGDDSLLVGKSHLLCSASLSMTRSDESSQAGVEGREMQLKGHSAGRHDEERVLISEVLVRNKDGEELERKDLETEALTALKACRANSALTIREVQEDVHRIINSGYFYSCMPVAVDTRDGIRLVFQV